MIASVGSPSELDQRKRFTDMKEDKQTEAPATDNIIRFDGSDRMMTRAASEQRHNEPDRPDASNRKTGEVIGFPSPTDPRAESQCRVSIYPEIKTGQSASEAVDPIEAMSEAFRRRIGWAPGGDVIGPCDIIVSMERPHPVTPVDSDKRFVAVDPQTYRGTATFDQATNQQLWRDQINVRSVPTQFLKAALPIFRKLNFRISPEQTMSLMQMTSIDEGTSEAIQAALFHAFNTSPYSIDMEAAVFALACFIHHDPLRKDRVINETFDEPYGERTVYGLWDFSPPEDE
jgi:hypothetical protein